MSRKRFLKNGAHKRGYFGRFRPFIASANPRAYAEGYDKIDWSDGLVKRVRSHPRNQLMERTFEELSERIHQNPVLRLLRKKPPPEPKRVPPSRFEYRRKQR